MPSASCSPPTSATKDSNKWTATPSRPDLKPHWLAIRDERRRSQRHRSIANGPNQGANGLGDQQEGEDFLAENCKKDGIQTTESGLQYRHEVVGTGAAPDANDK